MASEFEFDIACVAGLRPAEPAPTFSSPVELSVHEEYEVRVYDVEWERRLVAAIQIVSPSNKYEVSVRELFVGRLVSLLQQGVSVSLVDLVTDWQANLYAEVLARFRLSDPTLVALPPSVYAVTLRARKPNANLPRLDAWFYPVTVDRPLPEISLWLTEDLSVTLPLEAGYEETCRVLGIA